VDKETGRVIRASEVGQYKFCARAWWLGSVLGKPSVNTRELAEGEAAHQRHGRTVWASRALTYVALALVVLALIVLAVTLIH
jgi:hypothetical protein